MFVAQQQQQNKIVMALIKNKKAWIFGESLRLKILSILNILKPLTKDHNHVNLGTSFWTVLQCNCFFTKNFDCVFIYIGS